MAEGGDAARRARWLLLGGAAAGIGLAAAGLVRGAGSPSLAAGEVARVNGTPIRAEQLERLVGAVAADKRGPVTEADRARVLARLVEEELLVQRGVEIGLVASEPAVRKALVAAVIDSIVAEAESDEPGEAELRRFYEERRSYFGAGERLRVERLVFRAGARPAPPRARAEEARSALAAGEPVAAVRERLADPPALPLPDAPLPPHTLRGYLGPGAVDAATAEPPGAWSAPVETAEGVELVRVAERRAAEAPPFEEVAEQVAAEWRREQGDRSLREYLDWLRGEAELVLAPEAPRERESAE
jgi:hypothetical protein